MAHNWCFSAAATAALYSLLGRRTPSYHQSECSKSALSRKHHHTHCLLLRSPAYCAAPESDNGFETQLTRFCSKCNIPHWATPQWIKREDGHQAIRVKLPRGVPIRKVASRVADFRRMREPATQDEAAAQRRRHHASGVSIQTRHCGMSGSYTRVVVTPGPQDQDRIPCVVEFHSKELPFASCDMEVEDAQCELTVDVYRPGGTLVQADVDTVELLLYLGHVRPLGPSAEENANVYPGADGVERVAIGSDNPFAWMEDAMRRNFVFSTTPFEQDPFFNITEAVFGPLGSMFFGSPFLPGSVGVNPELGTTEPYTDIDKTDFPWGDAGGAQRVRPRYHTSKDPDAQLRQTKSQLENMGALVYLPSDAKEKLDWSDLAGYEEAKQLIEETLLMALSHPEVFDKVTAATRGKTGESNRPRMILFNGPPGTGKTSTARIIASTVQLPLIYVSLECIVSKWFGESEKNLSKIFDLARTLGQTYKGCVIFVDEIDSLAPSRDDHGVHEASRRMLSILLRRLDGFDTQNDKTILICATNRERDLDEAFRSRVDVTVMFPLPSHEARRSIIHRYAKHLSDKDLELLASNTVGLSGRNIRDFCQRAERSWVAKLLRDQQETSDPQAPSVDYYLSAALEKQQQQA